MKEETAKKILVVDDEPHLVEVIANRLRVHHYEVLTAILGEEGFEKACTEMPDLILLDNVLPGRLGSDLVLKLRKKDSEFRKTPIIIVSGKGEMIYQKKSNEFKWLPNNPITKTRGQLPDVRGAEALAQAYGVNDYVAKPFKIEILLEVVQEVIKKTRKVTEEKTIEEPPI